MEPRLNLPWVVTRQPGVKPARPRHRDNTSLYQSRG